jgi:hypothetical protein
MSWDYYKGPSKPERYWTGRDCGPQHGPPRGTPGGRPLHGPIRVGPVRFPGSGPPRKVTVDIITCPKTNRLIDTVSNEHKNCPHYDSDLILHKNCKLVAKESDRLAGRKGGKR